MRILTVLVVSLTIALVGCDEKSAPTASATTSAPGASARQYRTTLEDFPDWIPLPKEFVVLTDMKSGEFKRTTALETGGDVRDVVEHLNAKLSAAGLKNISVLPPKGDRGFRAQGIIPNDTKSVIINIGEYKPGDSAMKPGNTASVSYQISN
ncbi:MAG: hypothetical protein H0U74_14170 [Bradymonadaceae bacterium]|nr:hypothetical protein [Lujinxingiaceae bacterium]